MPKTKIVKKSERDKFYTKPSVAEILFQDLIETIGFLDLKIEKIIEPAAGDCAFYDKIPSDLRVGYDIEPTAKSISSGVIKADWFDIDLSKINNFAVVGNPPFGERNKLTNMFIKHALKNEHCKVIAFILPSVYNKYSMQKVFPKEWGLFKNIKIPDNAFLLNKQEYHVPCYFQIWVKDLKEDLDQRQIEPNLENEDFKFCKREDSDFFVFGAAPHKLLQPKDVKINNRGYYIQCKKDKEFVKNSFEKIDWKKFGKSSVSGGVFWLTKGEIVEYYLKTQIT